MAKSNKLETDQLDQINEVSIFTPIINSILKRKTDRKAKELQKDPKLAASYKAMEASIHAFQRSMDVYLDSTSKMLQTYDQGDERSDIYKKWDKRMKKYGPEIHKKWKQLVK